jgi:hypothetical protein
MIRQAQSVYVQTQKNREGGQDGGSEQGVRMASRGLRCRNRRGSTPRISCGSRTPVGFPGFTIVTIFT